GSVASLTPLNATCARWHASAISASLTMSHIPTSPTLGSHSLETSERLVMAQGRSGPCLLGWSRKDAGMDRAASGLSGDQPPSPERRCDGPQRWPPGDRC